MKRSLEVLVEPGGDQVPLPQVLLAGDTTVMIFDEGDGSGSSRLASCMEEAGATRHDAGTEEEAIRIVIRAPALTAQARKRAATLEAAAGVVLGSPRPVFARLLVEALLGDR